MPSIKAQKNAFSSENIVGLYIRFGSTYQRANKKNIKEILLNINYKGVKMGSCRMGRRHVDNFIKLNKY